MPDGLHGDYTSVMTGLQYPAPNMRFSMDMADWSLPLSGEPLPSQAPLPVRAKLERDRERGACDREGM